MVSRKMSLLFHTFVDMFKVDSPLPKNKQTTIIVLGMDELLMKEEGKNDSTWMIVRMGIRWNDFGLM